MLTQIAGESQLTLAAIQAVVVTVLGLAVTLLARGCAIRLEREVALAMGRGLVQIVIVGSVLVLLLSGPNWTSAIVLAGMIFIAARIASRRAQGLPDAFRVSLYGIALGGGSVIVLMTWLGVIEGSLTALIPVGSMLIANAMNSNALALERFQAEIESHVGHIETALALGAEPNAAIAPYVQAAVRASLIPRIDSISSLGIVWIPGVMTGLVLAGSDPIYAAIYQFVIMGMIFASSSLTSLVSTLLIRTRVISSADQLIAPTIATS